MRTVNLINVELAMPVDATQPYDDNNIFAKILRGEIPSTSMRRRQPISS